VIPVAGVKRVAHALDTVGVDVMLALRQAMIDVGGTGNTEL
jgi:hypothetical protein